MARVLNSDAAAQARWQDAALAALESMGLPPRRSPGGGLAPPTVRSDRRELLAALRLRRLSPMQRPLLLRAWASGHDELDPTALHLLAIVLDTPLPTPAVAAG
jgi:hypothetical protein